MKSSNRIFFLSLVKNESELALGEHGLSRLEWPRTTLAGSVRGFFGTGSVDGISSKVAVREREVASAMAGPALEEDPPSVYLG